VIKLLLKTIYGELGRIDLKTIRIYSAVKFWLKILGANERKYINVVYKLMLSDLTLHPNKTNWASLMRDTLSRLGFYHVWLEQGVANPKVFLSILKTRLRDIFIQDWKSRLEKSTRALVYNTLDNLNVKSFRVAVSRLRVSSYRLEVEKGRLKTPPVPYNN